MKNEANGLSLALLVKCWWGVNKLFIKRFLRKIKNSLCSPRKPSDLRKKLDEYRGKHLVLLGSSLSALEYEEYYQKNGKPNDHVVIGCNFTNYLDIDLDVYISAHLIACCVADKSKNKPKLIVNANQTGMAPGGRVFGVRRENFGADVAKVMAASDSSGPLCLYTNQNVLFLMLSLAYNLAPKSITFCGFEDTSKQELRARFYQKSPEIMSEMFYDINSLEELFLMGHGYTCPASELVSLAYNYFWVPLLQFVVEEKKISESDERVSHVENVSTIRGEYIAEFLKLDRCEIPLFRFGKTTLFSELPINPCMK